MSDKLPIKIKQITDPRDLEVINRFAATFAHEPIENLYWPLYLVTNMEDKPLGYFQIASGPIIFPAISPDCSPRNVLASVKEIVRRLHETEPTVYAVASHENFSDKIMNHLGFDPEIHGSRLYSSHNK